MGRGEIAKAYDEMYSRPNYFGDRLWLYRPYVRALMGRAKLKPGARLLDAGCGQGFFTSLFAQNGLNALGVDCSEVGIRAATQIYGASGATFKSGDIRDLGGENGFDCVFTRSCSLYNTPEFEDQHEFTDLLLSYVRSGGMLIFDYYSKLNPKHRSSEWIYHSLENVQKHFARYPGAQVYFSLRIETLLLGRFSFTERVSRICSFLSHRSGTGGELVAIVEKRQ